MAYDTLYKVIMTFCKLACPVIPFTTEEIYQNLKQDGDPESIHLCDFPTYCEKHRDLALEHMMQITVDAITMGRALRSANNIKNRQPLKKVILVDRLEKDRKVFEQMRNIIAEELNVKDVDIKADESSLVDYEAKANFKVLGSRLGKAMKEVASKIQNLHKDAIASLIDGVKHVIEYGDGEKIELTDKDLVIVRHEKENLKIINQGDITIGFDTEVTEDLLFEGIARDIVRSVQNTRKEKGLEVSDRINLRISGDEIVGKVCSSFGDYIKNETLALSLVFDPNMVGEENESGILLEIEKA